MTMNSCRAVWASLVSLLLFGACVHAETAVYKLHTDSSCSSAPTIIGFQESPLPSCSAITTCTSVNVDGEDLYWDRACASDEYKTLSASAYGAKPYVLMEIYESGAECKKLLSGAAFLSDSSCLVTDNGLSSVKVSVYNDGSASFKTFSGVSCGGTAVKTTQVTNSSIASHSCENGALRFYASDVATTSTSTSNEAEDTDKSISTTTSQSAPRTFDVSILLTATITAILGVISLY